MASSDQMLDSLAVAAEAWLVATEAAEVTPVPNDWISRRLDVIDARGTYERCAVDYLSASSDPEKPVPGEHHWLTPEMQAARGWATIAAHGWTSCLWCGRIKQRNGKSSPCPGIVRIGLR